MIDLIKKAFEEDLPTGDLTTRSLQLDAIHGQAKLLAKQDLVLSGCDIFSTCILYMDPEAKISWQFKDGNSVLKNQIAALVTGNLVRILQAERVALNFLCHLTGIATLTKKFVQQIRHTDTQILDTRKTTPGWRELEKKAVHDGGGTNHRMNLSDAILIKDNHIAACGGVQNAIERARKSSKLPIEIECKTLYEVEIAIQYDIQQILLDNMDSETLKKSLKSIPKSIKTEASGNMTLDRVREIAELGVNFISVGAITHSAPYADMSLKFDWSQT